MKLVTFSHTRWVVPALAALITAGSMNEVGAQPKAPVKATNANKATKLPRPRSKTVTGTFTQATAAAIKLNAKDGEINALLVPTTEYWQVQSGLRASDLKVGDTVKFTMKGTDGMATVQTLSPLTLKFGDIATLTFDKPSRMKFDRASKLTATDLAMGQTAKVAGNLFPDGRIEAREVWVIVAPQKPAKAVANP